MGNKGGEWGSPKTPPACAWPRHLSAAWGLHLAGSGCSFNLLGRVALARSVAWWP